MKRERVENRDATSQFLHRKQADFEIAFQNIMVPSLECNSPLIVVGCLSQFDLLKHRCHNHIYKNIM